MDREFQHAFWPSGEIPFSGPAMLSVEEIEDAGLLEVVQAPGAGFGHWRVLGQLLSSGKPFVFREPLGQSREVKVALSGLFGRFVARAYLTRHLGYQFFAHVNLSGVALNQSLNLGVIKTSRGDLPDWVTAPTDLATIAVAEAKGSHDPAGPWNALDRAWAQANRIHVEKDGKRLSVKRVAIVTRWAVSTGMLSTPWIAVRDPVEEGDVSDPEIEAAAVVGIVRHHIANLVEPLGHSDLSSSLRQLIRASASGDQEALIDDAHRHVEEAAVSTNRADDLGIPLIGGIVSRAGPLRTPSAAPDALEMLDALDLRPTFVGLNSALASAAIQGDLSLIRGAMDDASKAPDTTRDDIASDTRTAPPPDRDDAVDQRRHVGARVIRLTDRT